MQLDDRSLDLIFREAHTHSNWLDKPVSDALLHQIYDLMKWAPTSANGCPGRFVFVRSAEAKQRLLPAMAPDNVEKTRTAPVTVIVGYDLEFYEKLPRLFPQTDARSWYVGNQPLIATTAFRNGTLQGAYLLIAARALGLDAGPMSGFDNEKVDQEFFAGTRVKSNFVINLGYGDSSKLYPRNPRLPFEEAAQIL
ncbi:MAG: malonic semialdehyde reductase [Gallionellales bacterium RIFCSPLOWO2_02_FULL_57_47]|nr:MAG: malonic semialdehyde reductase [Gallionellales bacterium RIFCSPLOWO2_02_FULL_57_47]OGT09466.1 MAG: malonic semialdehyde reductase [Gallionellales bacterium RIFCSPHIGHO2_02_FULL_57_16]